MLLLGLVEVPAWILMVLLVPLSLYIYTTYKQSYFKRKGIPGPKPVPFLGVFTGVSEKGNTYLNGEYLEQHGKCFGEFQGNYPRLVVADSDMLREINVKQFSKFADRALAFGRNRFWRCGLPDASGDHWKFMRNTISPTFSSGKLKKMTSLITDTVAVLMECIEKQMKDNPEMDIQPLMRAFSMDTICHTAFGIDTDSQRNPGDAFVTNALKAFTPNPACMRRYKLCKMFPELGDTIFKEMNFVDPVAVEFFKGATKDIIAERKKDNADHKDLLYLMLKSRMDAVPDGELPEALHTLKDYKLRGMTDDELVVNSTILLVAGFDTTSTALGWLCYCLATHPQYQDKLHQEIQDHIGKDAVTYENVLRLEYLDMVVCETLRLYGPSVRTDRRVLEDVEICGVHMEKGLEIIVPIYAIHHYPEYWPDPHVFDPQRFSPENKEKIVPYTYLPFGLGPRNCVGQRLALLEIKIAIVTLLQEYQLDKTDRVRVPPVLLTTSGLSVKQADCWLKLVKR